VSVRVRLFEGPTVVNRLLPSLCIVWLIPSVTFSVVCACGLHTALAIVACSGCYGDYRRAKAVACHEANFSRQRFIYQESEDIMSELIQGSLIDFDVNTRRYSQNTLLRHYIYATFAKEVPDACKAATKVMSSEPRRCRRVVHSSHSNCIFFK
jgi:hypothetical protein